jgi:hypothetical protein
MRLWTLHPKYLDAAGLVAVWREGLLAQRVLSGRTRGYQSHPQLTRFRSHAAPRACIARYLAGVLEESRARGYRFNASKIGRSVTTTRLPETRGQLLCEWRHLKRKLRDRAPRLLRRVRPIEVPDAHPLFRIVAGGVRNWERAGRAGTRTRRSARAVATSTSRKPSQPPASASARSES